MRITNSQYNFTNTANMKRDMYLRPLPGRSQVPVFPSKIWRPACTCTCDQYLAWRSQVPVFHPKYDARRVSETGSYHPTKIWGAEAWAIVGTYFPTKNMKPGIYNTWDLASRRYLFCHPKYEARGMPATVAYLFKKIWGAEAWPVAGTCNPTQNIKPGMYLRPGR